MIIFYRYLILLFTLIVIGCSQEQKIQVVPDWAKDAVWYQIFPERFNNGDKNNDPGPIELKGSWPYQVPEKWEPHPWTSDWYKLQPWEENGHDFYWNVQIRRYGGDLQGVIDKLDYLEELGINAIYFNPVFESPSLHKYDATFYHHIDNNFGPDPEGDRNLWEEEVHWDPTTWKWTGADKLFLELIEEAHKRNIKIIIDGVFNHVGRTFWAFQDIIQNQEKSQFKNWFTINSFDNPNTEENEFDYEGWYGAKDLPEIREDENGLIPDAANHIHHILKRWMDPNNDGDPSDGIDGWRLDVAEMVKHKFWQKFRTWVKKINPDAYITGEIWWDNWSINKMMNASPWLKGDQFDAVMNYRFTRAVKHFISDQDSQITSTAFIDTINLIRKDYNDNHLYVLMNLLGSHDTERLSSLIINPDQWYDHNAVPNKRKEFDVRKPNKLEKMKQKLMVGIQFTMPGAPMIYYGDEAGMWGGDDPDCRKPMVWPGRIYETEVTHPSGKYRQPNTVSFDSTIFSWYALMTKIRNQHIELRRGELTFEKTSDDKILIYNREFENEKSTIIVNNSEIVKNVKLNSINIDAINLVNRKKVNIHDGTIELKPFEIAMLK